MAPSVPYICTIRTYLGRNERPVLQLFLQHPRYRDLSLALAHEHLKRFQQIARCTRGTCHKFPSGKLADVVGILSRQAVPHERLLDGETEIQHCANKYQCVIVIIVVRVFEFE